LVFIGRNLSAIQRKAGTIALPKSGRVKPRKITVSD
jgi:hypothetical protein